VASVIIRTGQEGLLLCTNSLRLKYGGYDKIQAALIPANISLLRSGSGPEPFHMTCARKGAWARADIIPIDGLHNATPAFTNILEGPIGGPYSCSPVLILRF